MSAGTRDAKQLSMIIASSLRSFALSAVGALVCIEAGGCANRKEPRVIEPPLLTAAVVAPVATQSFSPPPIPVSPNMNVSPELATACKLEMNDVSRAPKFGFDQVNLEAEDAEVLNQIAKCVGIGGALAGRSIDLVGRADSRGDSEYNMALGAQRASAVFERLFTLGVDPGQMGESSLGELGATGKEENGWRRDRRVDITLR